MPIVAFRDDSGHFFVICLCIIPAFCVHTNCDKAVCSRKRSVPLWQTKQRSHRRCKTITTPCPRLFRKAFRKARRALTICSRCVRSRKRCNKKSTAEAVFFLLCYLSVLGLCARQLQRKDVGCGIFLRGGGRFRRSSGRCGVRVGGRLRQVGRRFGVVRRLRGVVAGGKQCNQADAQKGAKQQAENLFGQYSSSIRQTVVDRNAPPHC